MTTRLIGTPPLAFVFADTTDVKAGRILPDIDAIWSFSGLIGSVANFLFEGCRSAVSLEGLPSAGLLPWW